MRDEITGLEAALRSGGISVETLDRGDPVRLTYLTAFPGAHVDHREIGRALTVLIDLAEDGRLDPTRVEATVVRTDDDVKGRWRTEREWFEALLSNELNEAEFSMRVLDTPEGHDRDEPEGGDAGFYGEGVEV